MLKECFKRISKNLSILILDFNRPNESFTLLTSIKKHVKVDYEVIFLSNGGNQDYVFDLYERGLIDKCILNKKNEGSGFGTIRLTEFCQSKYFLNLQCDHAFIRDFEEAEFDEIKQVLEDPSVGSIDLTFLSKIQNGNFSERAFICKTEFYCSNPFQEGGGTGPEQNLNFKGSEPAMSEWLKCNSKKSITWQPQLVVDTGQYAVIETKCGGVLKRRCDTHEIKVLKRPNEKMPMWSLSDSDWERIINGEWKDWEIPENSKGWIFFLFREEFENPNLNNKYFKLALENSKRLRRRN